MSRKRKINIALVISAFILISGIYLLVITEQAPAEAVSKARIELSLAQKDLMPPSSQKILENAGVYYDSAMAAWKAENTRIFFRRDFKKTREYADTAASLAMKSIESAGNERALIISRLTSGFTRTEQLINKLDFICSSIPGDEKKQNEFAMGQIAFSEAKLAFKSDQLSQAETKLNEANTIINRCMESSVRILEKYFESYPDWRKLVQKSINDSKNKNTSLLVVDKFDRKCTVYKKGLVVSEFSVELGRNWIGDKKHNGDKTTPEGRYRVIKKKKNSETKYYKALLLDYPNEEDKKRFTEGKKNGQISKSAHIGGLIEIHGHGGTGTDWTDGCIALENSDMDKLFSYSENGTVVIIVGSLRSLDEILK